MNTYIPDFPGILAWEMLHPKMTPDQLGYIPGFLSSLDPRPARDQFDERYGRYGGGWRPTAAKFELHDDGLHAPGDPVMPVLAETKLRDETIRYYLASWVAIIQPDGSYEVARLD